MKKQRKYCTPEEKVAILRRHLLGSEPISKLCNELGWQPTVFFRWQNEFFEDLISRKSQSISSKSVYRDLCQVVPPAFVTRFTNLLRYILP